MTKENFIRAKKAEEVLEYAPKYYVEGIVRANDIDAVGDIAELLYHFNAKTVKHIKTIRAMAEGEIPARVTMPLHIYWYEGIGYAESAIKNEFDAADFNEEYGGTTANGYNHAVEFNGVMSENNFTSLIFALRELSSDLGWAINLSGEIGEYSDSNKDCEFELKVEDLIKEDEITA